MRMVDSSDRSLLLIFGEEISVATHQDVLRLSSLLRYTPGVTNVHPAYASVLIDFDPLAIGRLQLRQAAGELHARAHAAPLDQPRTVEIPVIYGGEHGPDLEDVAAFTGLSPDDVVELHSNTDYLVYFLGFSPGFPYLGGLPESIAVPRLETPRRKVPAGSVAIGGKQTGVYPVASPGGWRIIGSTPLQLFQPDADPPTLLRMGDLVRFVPIARGAL
ncbi:MAG TPA: 5-oxoprolinase subunit PxpB [Bryobacteraceae bacterium]|nr:5-oxoprolinase subunit PxpB [Bryobacteraceae bacterium]